MNKIEELRQQIANLEKEIADLNNIENDIVFLLSIGEYEKYKNKIPYFCCWWWLRSPGDLQDYAAYVNYYGSVNYSGSGVNRGDGCVRPALDISNVKQNNLKFIDENTLIHCGVTWKKIDDNLFIAEVPIAAHSFDKKSNDYKTSEIRQFLLNWYEERKDW